MAEPLVASRQAVAEAPPPTADGAGRPHDSHATALEPLLRRAAAADWRGAPSETLAAAIEDRIVDPLPSRLRAGLGAGEAECVARLVAWQRCHALAGDSPRRLTWGFLANHVRWRVADRLDAEVLRARRHPLTDTLPERAAADPIDPAEGGELGEALELLVDRLEACGCRPARRWVVAALDGDRLGRRSITDRLVQAGLRPAQADALAVLLRGGRGFVSVVARVASGEHPEAVFAEPAVRRRMTRLVGVPLPPPGPGSWWPGSGRRQPLIRA
jgi:hypothetical protein